MDKTNQKMSLTAVNDKKIVIYWKVSIQPVDEDEGKSGAVGGGDSGGAVAIGWEVGGVQDVWGGGATAVDVAQEYDGGGSEGGP